MLTLPPQHAVKVLKNSASWHGGAHTWSLPTQAPDGAWTPGDWTPSVTPSLCSRGWHLTTEPAQWWGVEPGIVGYLAEYDGAVERRDGEDKIAVERCRLLRPLTPAELADSGIYAEGEHAAKGHRKVFAYASATVEAYDSATVEAYDSATVRAYGSATVRAYGSATVRAYDSATVEAYASAKTHAAGQSTCVAWSGTTLVLTREGRGVIVDRRGPTPKTYCKRAGLDGWRFVDGTWVQRRARLKAPSRAA